MTRFPSWHLALVVAVCLLSFGNSLSGELIWDDEVQIGQNPAIRDASNIPGSFGRPFFSFVTGDQPNRTNFYRPLQTVAYTVGYALGGLAPEPYHAISIGLHALASVAVYLVCAELGFAPMLALLGAALFAAHPIHTEAVSWIAATPDVACGLFYFTALWCFLKSDNGQRKAWWIASALTMLPALLSKEMAITLPVILLLLTYRSGGTPLRLGQRVQLLLPYGGVTAVYLAMRVHALGFVATNQTPAQAGLFDWITLGFRAFGEYLWLCFVPYPLVAYRMVPLHFGDRMGATLLAAGVGLGLAGLAWKLRPRFPDGPLWFGAFLVSLAPVFYFRAISSTLMSERYLYIPSIIAVLFVVNLLQRSHSKTWIWATWAVLAVFVGGCMVRNQDWSTGERLYTRTIQQEPRSGVFHLSLANLMLKRNEDQQVLYHLTEAERNLNDPAYAPVPYDRYNLHVTMAAVLLRTGALDQAITHLNEAAKANPKGEWVAVYSGAVRMAKYSDDAGAASLLESAVKINPKNEVAYDYLGTAYYNLGRYEEALAAFEKAVALKPDFATARQHLALLQQNPQ